MPMAASNKASNPKPLATHAVWRIPLTCLLPEMTSSIELSQSGSTGSKAWASARIAAFIHDSDFHPGLRLFRRKTAPANDRNAEDLEPIRADVEVRSAHRQPVLRLFARHGDRQAPSA